MTISQRDYDLLKGLKDCGHAYVAASEVEDALRLVDAGLVEKWTIGTGFDAWRLTPAGRERIERAIAHHEAII